MWPLVRNENTKRNIFRGKMSASRAAARRRCVPSSIRSAMFISSRPPEGQAPSGAACDECAESKPNMLLPTQLESEAVGRCDDKRGASDGAFSALQRWLGGRFVCLRRSSLLAGCIGGCLADRKSTRLNSSHQILSYAVFCLKKKNESPRSV